MEPQAPGPLRVLQHAPQSSTASPSPPPPPLGLEDQLSQLSQILEEDSQELDIQGSPVQAAPPGPVLTQMSSSDDGEPPFDTFQASHRQDIEEPTERVEALRRELRAAQEELETRQNGREENRQCLRIASLGDGFSPELGRTLVSIAKCKLGQLLDRRASATSDHIRLNSETIALWECVRVLRTFLDQIKPHSRDLYQNYKNHTHGHKHHILNDVPTAQGDQRFMVPTPFTLSVEDVTEALTTMTNHEKRLQVQYAPLRNTSLPKKTNSARRKSASRHTLAHITDDLLPLLTPGDAASLALNADQFVASNEPARKKRRLGE